MSAKLSTIASVTAIAAVTAAITGGTYAKFNDVEAVKDNKVASGTLDLELDPLATGTGAEPTVINVSKAQPGDSGSQKIYVSNTGTVPGTLSIDLDDLVPAENGCSEPESVQETAVAAATADVNDTATCQSTAQDGGTTAFGELQDQMYITITNPDGVKIVDNKTLADAIDDTLATYALAADSARGLYTVSWSIKDESGTTNNLVQSDSVQFNVEFFIEQSRAAATNNV